MPNFVSQLRFQNYSEIEGDQVDQLFDSLDGLAIDTNGDGAVTQEIYNILVSGGTLVDNFAQVQKSMDFPWTDIIYGAKATLKFRAELQRLASSTSPILITTIDGLLPVDAFGFQFDQNQIKGIWGNGVDSSSILLVDSLADDYTYNALFEAIFRTGIGIDFLIDGVGIARGTGDLPRVTTALNPFFTIRAPGGDGAASFVKISRLRVQTNL